ncbi:MAG: hypothetical protein ABIA74_01105 [bacterium]
MLKKINLFVMLFLLFFISLFSQNFVIKKESTREKVVSKTELKENIGSEIKNVLHEVSNVSKKLGEIQIELAEMQKQLFEKVEKLIDNQRPFKKASREELNQTLKVIQSVNSKLSVQSNVVNQIKNEINKDVCLKTG